MKRTLTDTAAKNAKLSPNGKQKKHFDGGGMFLLVKPTGKVWRYKYTLDGVEKTLTIGSYPEISLAEARRMHEEARALLARGVDPSAHKQATKDARLAATANSFEAVALEWHAKFSPRQAITHSDRNKRRLERHVFPYIGSRPIAELEPPDILSVLQRIEGAGILETAHRVKYIIGQVFRYAVVTGRATRDQTADLKGALPPSRKNHFPAITDPQEAGELLQAIYLMRGTTETRTALMLAPYLFVRPGELRQMEWAEVDMGKAVWDIPAEKMKMGVSHLVPLPRQAVALLEGIKPLTGHRRHVFPSTTDRERPISINTLNLALKRLGYGGQMTAHGFRAMARTMLDEQLGVDEKYIEQQLAHEVSDPLGRAYNRTKHIRERTTMMQQWADYLDSLRDTRKPA